MQHGPLWLQLFLLLLLVLPLTPADLGKVRVEVITDSSACSTTCGLGVKTQTLCLIRNGEMAMEGNVKSTDATKVSEECRVRKVKCFEIWQCGLVTMTVTIGQKVKLDCLGDVMKAMGRFSWRVSWRHARGVITSDDSLFSRWEAPHLDQLVLDAVTENDAGTYRCDVQDTTYRQVKRIYWGIRVLPSGIFNLDYDSSEDEWASTGNPKTAAADTSHLSGIGDDV
ncbi:transmembrane protein 81 [Brachyistius frenatus]|uniref:transmembrane protein 81 n=1 Tax=Brachyistius frenatus TaxID=100188 RepID=UPI0037E7711A